MSEWSPTNPVERRFLQAHEDWLRFAGESEARLLYWQADEDDRQMVDLYLQMQQETSCSVIDFIHPFREPDAYLTQAAQALIAFYRERQEGAAQQGIVADWTPPASECGGAAWFFSVAVSLMRHHPDIFPGLVFILRPAQLEQPRRFEKMLETLLETLATLGEDGARMRFILPQSPLTPSLAALQQRQPQRMRTFFGRYHMRRLPGEVVAESGERGPSGEFRRLFVILGDTMRNDDLPRLAAVRQEMLAIAQQQGWPDQAAVVYLTTGAAYLKAGQPKPAQHEYRQAIQAAQQAQNAGHPAGNKLVVNALFGEASVWLHGKSYREAALCYQAAAQRAQEDGDGILAVEGWRMNAWCLDKLGQHGDALDAALKGLDAGMLIDAPMRDGCSLPLLAQWLAEHRSLAFHPLRNRALQQKLFLLYGDNWRNGAAAPTTADREV